MEFFDIKIINRPFFKDGRTLPIIYQEYLEDTFGRCKLTKVSSKSVKFSIEYEYFLKKKGLRLKIWT